jgi:Putative MetA-pathway of phenol degradation
MKRCRALLLFFLVALLPAALSAQSFNLRDLLTDFLRQGITLAPPQPPFPSHETHFIGADSPQFQAVQQLNQQIANQLSTFPLASSAGGFTYTFDPNLGVFSRATDSFGPIYAERADTIGRGRFNLGLSYSHYTFDHINDLSLRNGGLKLVFTHIDTNADQSNFQPWFEGDVITATLFVKIQTDITAFEMTYGLGDRFDVGLAVPIVHVELNAVTAATIDRLATATNAPGIHQFLNGTSSETFQQSGTASGVGDVVLRAKYRLTSNASPGLALAADVRLPTGDEGNLLGTGTTQVKLYAVGSAHLAAFSPHFNAGYTFSNHRSGQPRLPDEISYSGGFDWALSPRLTFMVDALGRTFRDTQIVSVENATFVANTNPSPVTPPVFNTAVLPRLVTRDGNLTTFLGSIGFKVNPVGNLLLTVNGLFSLNKNGLRDDFTPLIGLDYSF